ncbi:MAG TPA: hypothetical protein VGQ57_08175 [Polyangiaceae bacterium]|nr:hypothetical protein [Polyangiaceae bacterium]
MAPAAVRIPDPRHTNIPFDFSALGQSRIFIHEGARQALERRLELAFGGPVQLAVTDNLRRMVSHARVRGTRRVRVHMMFLGAPERVRLALVEYVVRGNREASGVLGKYIEDNNHRIRASRPVVGPLHTRGRSHDLAEVLADVNARYFAGAMGDVLVTWGRRTRPLKEARSTIKLGSYSATERLIRVHPALDRDWVPRYFVSYIVFHELLHHVIPPVPGSLHPPALLQREREFRFYERALAWEQKHIERLLKSR